MNVLDEGGEENIFDLTDIYKHSSIINIAFFFFLLIVFTSFCIFLVLI